MKYPEYDINELELAEREGNFETTDFSNFIFKLIESDEFEHDTERGIAAFIDSNGTAGLSESQKKVLEIIVSRYDNEECKLCGIKIPLNEVFDDNNGFCSYHKWQADKDED